MPQEDMVVVEPKVYCLGELVDIEKVKPNPENPKIHPDEQLRILAGILEVNGWRQSIIVSRRSGMVVKGHGRLQTAQFMKLKSVPIEYQGYTDEQAELADMIADNRAGEHGYIDAFMMGGILKKIGDKGKETLGYSQEEMDLYMAAEYIAPQATDRKFVVLETLKLTKEAKAIIAGAVQKFCLRMSKEMDWGEALAQICMSWQVNVLPGMPQIAPAQAPAPAKPAAEAAAPKPVKEKKSKKKEDPAPVNDHEGDEYERDFKVKRVAGTTLGDLGVTVIVADDDVRYYTQDEAIVKTAKAAKESGMEIKTVMVMKNKNLWITEAK